MVNSSSVHQLSESRENDWGRKYDGLDGSISAIYMEDGQWNKEGSVCDWTTEILNSMQHTLYSIMPTDFPQYTYDNIEVGGRRQ